MIISRYFNNRAEHLYIIYTVKPQKLRLGKRARDGTKRMNALLEFFTKRWNGTIQLQVSLYFVQCFKLFLPPSVYNIYFFDANSGIEERRPLHLSPTNLGFSSLLSLQSSLGVINGFPVTDAILEQIQSSLSHRSLKTGNQ